MSVLGKLYTLFCGITFFALLLTHGLVQAVRLVAPSHTLCVLRMLYKCEGNFNLCLSMYWYALRLLLFFSIFNDFDHNPDSLSGTAVARPCTG